MRCLAHHHHRRIDLWTRELKPISAPLVKLRRQIMSMAPDETILDGILFGAGKTYDRYFTFDIPQFKNKGTGRLIERAWLLKYLYKNQANISIPDHHPEQNKLLFYYHATKLSNIKGIILKDLSSMYPIVTKARPTTNSWIEITSQHIDSMNDFKVQ
jgi:ATP-dependent DNA ligase